VRKSSTAALSKEIAFAFMRGVFYSGKEAEDVTLRRGCIALAMLVITGAWEARKGHTIMPEDNVELTVHLAAPVRGRAVPVSGGIPFPRGALAPTDGVRLADSAGREVPVQTEVLATWEPARKSVRWLLLDFAVKGHPAGPATFTLRYGPGVKASRSAPPIEPRRSPWSPEKILAALYHYNAKNRNIFVISISRHL